MDVSKQAWPEGIPMSRDTLLIDVDGQQVRVPAQGPGNMFYHWLAWLPPERREAAYKLMNAGFDCYGVYLYLTGSGIEPSMRGGVANGN